MSLGIAQVARRLVSIAVTACLARLLAPDDFGLIALTTVAVQLVAIFAETGLGTALVQRKSVTREQLQTAFWTNLGVSGVLFLAGTMAAPAIAMLYGDNRITALMQVSLITLPLGSVGSIADAILQRRLAFAQLATIEWLAAFFSGVTAVLLAWYAFGVWALVAQSLVAVAVASSAKMIAAKWTPSATFCISEIYPMFGFGMSVLGCSVINYAAMNMQTIVIGRSLGVSELGYYTLALNLVMLPAAAITGLVSRVMFPALSAVVQEPGRLRRGYWRMLRSVSAVTFPIVVGLGVMAPTAVELLYGDRWKPVVPLIQILTVWGLFQAINVSGVVFYARARAGIMLAYACGSVVVITIAITAGASGGATGVAWALALVSPIVGLGPHLLAGRLVDLPVRRLIGSVAPAFIAVMFMAGAVLLVGSIAEARSLGTTLRTILAVVTGGVVYSTLLLVIGIVRGHRTNLARWVSGAERCVL